MALLLGMTIKLWAESAHCSCLCVYTQDLLGIEWSKVNAIVWCNRPAAFVFRPTIHLLGGAHKDLCLDCFHAGAQYGPQNQYVETWPSYVAMEAPRTANHVWGRKKERANVWAGNGPIALSFCSWPHCYGLPCRDPQGIILSTSPTWVRAADAPPSSFQAGHEELRCFQFQFASWMGASVL